VDSQDRPTDRPVDRGFTAWRHRRPEVSLRIDESRGQVVAGGLVSDRFAIGVSIGASLGAQFVEELPHQIEGRARALTRGCHDTAMALSAQIR
jgi:hypothetical protein